MSAPIVTIYKNGDLHFFGKKLVVNRKQLRTFDNFLDQVTRDTRAGVAIRSIRTPNHGTRIFNLEKLENGGVYVAVGMEKFKTIRYNEIKGPTINFGKPAETFVRPVLHSKIQTSARALKVAKAEPLKNRIIFVYQNGEEKFPGVKLLLDKRILQNMDTVLQFVTNKVKLRTGAVRSIYSLDGVEVKETKDIQTGFKYVAVGYGKRFIKAMYSDQVTSPRNKAPSKNLSIDSSSKYGGTKKTRLKPLKQRPPDQTKHNKVGNKTVVENNPKKTTSDSEKDKGFLLELIDDSHETAVKRTTNGKNETFLSTENETLLGEVIADSTSKPENENDDVENIFKSSYDKTDAANEDNNNNVTSQEEQNNAIQTTNKTKPRKKTSKAFGKGFEKVVTKKPKEKSSLSRENINKSIDTNSSDKSDESADVKDTNDNAKQNNEIEKNISEDIVENEFSGTPPPTDIEDIESEGPETKPASPAVYEASGKQTETAKVIKDTDEMNVEKTIDNLPAEEVDEEEIAGEVPEEDTVTSPTAENNNP